MKSTSSALTPRKIAEFCKGRFTSMFTEGEVRLLYSCLVDLLERNEYPPYRGSGLDLQSLSAMLGIDVDRLRAHRAILQPIFDAVAREISNVTLRPARTPSRSIRLSYDFPRLCCESGAAVRHLIHAGWRRWSDRHRLGPSGAALECGRPPSIQGPERIPALQVRMTSIGQDRR